MLEMREYDGRSGCVYKQKERPIWITPGSLFTEGLFMERLVVLFGCVDGGLAGLLMPAFRRCPSRFCLFMYWRCFAEPPRPL